MQTKKLNAQQTVGAVNHILANYTKPEDMSGDVKARAFKDARVRAVRGIREFMSAVANVSLNDFEKVASMKLELEKQVKQMDSSVIEFNRFLSTNSEKYKGSKSEIFAAAKKDWLESMGTSWEKAKSLKFEDVFPKAPEVETK